MAVQSSNNTTCKLVVTYQWDDADQWRVKTVRIPIESSTGALGRLPANIMGPGLKNVPALDSFLPEASISYKDIFFESWVNESTNAAATPLWPRLYFSLDGEASSNDIGHQNTLISSRLYRRIWRRLDMSTNIEHEFKASTDTSLNMGFYCMPAVLNVTYTYWEPSTLRVLNSVVLAAADEVGFPGATTSTSASRFKRQLNIPEANPVLVRSGVLFSFIENATAAVNFNVKVGAQSAYTTYRTMPPGLVVCGGFFFMHNFDASSRAGQGIALSPTGSFFVDWYTTSVTAGSTGSNVSALLYLNYTCDKSTLPGGSANHMHTVIPHFFSHQATATIEQVVTKQPIDIPEVNRWVSGIVPVLSTWTPGTAQSPSSVVFSAQLDSSTDWGSGWTDLYAGTISMSQEFSPQLSFARARDSFRRWPFDSDTDRMYLEKSRSFNFQKPVVANFGSYWYISYHTMVTNVSGTLSNYTGNGGNIPITVYDESAWKNMVIYDATTNVGGTFSFPWYNPSINISAQA